MVIVQEVTPTLFLATTWTLYVPALLYACVLILVLSNPKSIIGGPLSPKSQVYIVLCVEPLKINN